VPLAPARTARFEAYVAPARVRPALWRLLLGTTLAALAWLGSVLLVFGLLDPGASGRAALLLYLASFAGLSLVQRWGGWDRRAFDAESVMHVSVYQKRPA
jgi:hypothetical protein